MVEHACVTQTHTYVYTQYMFMQHHGPRPFSNAVGVSIQSLSPHLIETMVKAYFNVIELIDTDSGLLGSGMLLCFEALAK